MTTTFVLRGAQVLDESGSFSGPVDTLVVDGRVAGVGPNLAAPAEAAEHDVAGLWVMPGVFDCHTHPTYSATSDAEPLQTPLTQWVLESAANLRRVLEAGVTFVRDAAGADVGMRESVLRGYVPGPRLQVSLNQRCQTGGHSDAFLQAVGTTSSGPRNGPGGRRRSWMASTRCDGWCGSSSGPASIGSSCARRAESCPRTTSPTRPT